MRDSYDRDFQVPRSSSAIIKTNKDLLVLGTDSGKIVILEYEDKSKRLKKTHEETFGKSGCRRIVPGISINT